MDYMQWSNDHCVEQIQCRVCAGKAAYLYVFPNPIGRVSVAVFFRVFIEEVP
jgi:hypothetical protein